MELAGWLRAIGVPQYAPNFLEHHIDEALLPSLTAGDLRDIGIPSVGHRRLILNAIAALSKTTREESAEAPRAEPDTIYPTFTSGERRPVAVLFADLCGFTRLSEDLEDEALHRILARYMSMAEGAQIGDAVMGVFGVPVARDDDTANAARAALAIRNGMSVLSEACGRRLDAHIGLALGEAIVGGMTGAPHNVIGASVNLAARVTGEARPGEVLVAEGLARQLSNRFRAGGPWILHRKGDQ